MLIKNGGMILDGISKPLRLLVRVRSAPAALLLGGFVLLFGPQLTAQDLLLKEYIYLDGRLLAVERQIVALTAQQPAEDANRARETGFALYSPFANRGIALPGGEDATAMSGIQSALAMRALHGPVFAGILAPEKGQNPFMASDNSTLRLDSCRWYWKASGIVGYGNGGNNDGL